MISLPYTGERLIPDRFHIQDRIVIEHLDRYRFAAKKIRQDYPGIESMLDVPCGTGYGASLLSEQLNCTVYGLDIDETTLEYAETRYGTGSKCTFIPGNLDSDTDWPYIPLISAVVCFEGIEHVQRQEFVASRITKHILPNGLIFVSTPRVHGPGSGSEFHTHELSKEELIDLFAPYCSEYELYGQDLRVGDCAPDENARYYIFVGRRNAHLSTGHYFS